MEDSQRLAIERGRKFAELMDGADGLSAIFDAMERSYFNDLKNSEIDDPEFREAVYHRIKALDDLRTVIATIIANGRNSERVGLEIRKRVEAYRKKA